MTRQTDLFGNDVDAPPGLLPAVAPFQPELVDAAAERAAIRTGRPKSQERAEILAPIADAPKIDDPIREVMRTIAGLANGLGDMYASALRFEDHVGDGRDKKKPTILEHFMKHDPEGFAAIAEPLGYLVRCALEMSGPAAEVLEFAQSHLDEKGDYDCFDGPDPELSTAERKTLQKQLHIFGVDGEEYAIAEAKRAPRTPEKRRKNPTPDEIKCNDCGLTWAQGVMRPDWNWIDDGFVGIMDCARCGNDTCHHCRARIDSEWGALCAKCFDLPADPDDVLAPDYAWRYADPSGQVCEISPLVTWYWQQPAPTAETPETKRRWSIVNGWTKPNMVDVTWLPITLEQYDVLRAAQEVAHAVAHGDGGVEGEDLEDEALDDDEDEQ